MVKWRSILSIRPEKILVQVVFFTCAAGAACAQGSISIPELGPYIGAEPKIFDHIPPQPSQPPAFTIPLRPLGFSTPGPFYLLRRQALVSLDFLDESRLLFTFRKPGLETRDSAEKDEDEERKIRAVVVALPDGKIESEALWTVPDRARYLWILKDGQFLLRDSEGLEQGDATLKTKPYVHTAGRLLWVELDPARQVIVINWLAPANNQDRTSDGSSPTTSVDASVSSSGTLTPGRQQTLVVQTLRRESGEVIRTIRVPWDSQSQDWPINVDGFVESARGDGPRWALKLTPFSGGTGHAVGQVESNCPPNAVFVTEETMLVDTCAVGGGGKLAAISIANGERIWEVTTATNEMWPLLVSSPDGSRVALETLALKRPAASYRHKKLVGAKDLQGQMVRMIDMADGTMKLEAPLTPIIDAGGNVAISPSGRRVAILNDGAIEVFELPAARQ
ncbi:MAG TPA: hypothetical protein VMT38_05245 [Terracidiphilus sp.]|nr:hypothetical protein [Terracidiphilus sp.]